MSSTTSFSSFQLKRLFNIPPTTKFILISLIGFSSLLQFIKYKFFNNLIASGEKNVDFDAIIIPYLQLIPNYTLNHPWTIITAIFIESSIIKFIITFIIVLFSGKFIERSWSSKEFFKFILIIGGISNLIITISLIFWNILGISINFFNIPVDGNISILISFLVVFKQLIPEHSINIGEGIINIRVKHFPFVILLTSLIISAVKTSFTPFIQTWTGFFVSWIYLRFFQSNFVDPVLPQPNNVVGIQKLKGDASETFSLVHFFPNLLQPILTPVFEQFYELSIQLGLINGFNESEIEQSNLIANRRLTGHSTTNQDSRDIAERRRQVALKVLEERIGDDSSKTQNNVQTDQ